MSLRKSSVHVRAQLVEVEYVGLYSRRVCMVLWDVTAGQDLTRSLHVDPTVDIR